MFYQIIRRCMYTSDLAYRKVLAKQFKEKLLSYQM